MNNQVKNYIDSVKKNYIKFLVVLVITVSFSLYSILTKKDWISLSVTLKVKDSNFVSNTLSFYDMEETRVNKILDSDPRLHSVFSVKKCLTSENKIFGEKLDIKDFSFYFGFKEYEPGMMSLAISGPKEHELEYRRVVEKCLKEFETRVSKYKENLLNTIDDIIKIRKVIEKQVSFQKAAILEQSSYLEETAVLTNIRLYYQSVNTLKIDEINYKISSYLKLESVLYILVQLLIFNLLFSYFFYFVFFRL